MASLGHVAVGAAAARLWCGPNAGPRARWVAAAAFAGLALAPDLDVLAFALHIPYGAPFGHRGASHALLTALLLGGLIGVRRWSDRPRRRTAMFAIAVLASHGLLDTLTDGGMGVALFWPLDVTRYFAPLRPIPVAPIGAGTLSARGLYVLVVELVQFAPFWLMALWPSRGVLAKSD